jgi:hypothetical protein
MEVDNAKFLWQRIKAISVPEALFDPPLAAGQATTTYSNQPYS